MTKVGQLPVGFRVEEISVPIMEVGQLPGARAEFFLFIDPPMVLPFIISLESNLINFDLRLKHLGFLIRGILYVFQFLHTLLF